MAKYLRKFQTRADYEASKALLYTPNVTLVAEGRDVAYNAQIPAENKLLFVYNVTTTSEATNLFGEYSDQLSTIETVEIDGVELPEIVNSYVFDTTGAHVVKFGLKNASAIYRNAFFNNGADVPLVAVTIPNSVTSIGNAAFSGCTEVTMLNFIGTKAEWDSVSKDYDWCTGIATGVVHCIDGDALITVPEPEENPEETVE